MERYTVIFSYPSAGQDVIEVCTADISDEDDLIERFFEGRADLQSVDVEDVEILVFETRNIKNLSDQ